MSNVYTVKIDDRIIMHVEAKSAGAARKAALTNVSVERLNGSQILELSRSGKAIVSAGGQDSDASDEAA